MVPKTFSNPSRRKTLKIGDIYQVNLDPTIGDEIKKSRPVIILNAGHDKNLRLAIVVPVTAWNPRWKGNPFFLSIEPTSGHGLKKRSAVDCFQIRALSHARFIRKLGTLSQNDIDSIKRSIALILDIEPEHCVI